MGVSTKPWGSLPFLIPSPLPFPSLPLPSLPSLPPFPPGVVRKLGVLTPPKGCGKLSGI